MQSPIIDWFEFLKTVSLKKAMSEADIKNIESRSKGLSDRSISFHTQKSAKISEVRFYYKFTDTILESSARVFIIHTPQDNTHLDMLLRMLLAKEYPNKKIAYITIAKVTTFTSGEIFPF